MRIEYATPFDVMSVALRMRERDLAELLAVSFADDRKSLADMLAKRWGEFPHTVCVWNDDGPVVIAAAVEHRPNVLTLLLFATDDFPSVGIATTCFIVQRFFPPLIEAGIHRIEAVTMADYTDTHRWLKTIGLKQEAGPLRKFGKNGEEFVLFSWTDDVCAPGN